MKNLTFKQVKEEKEYFEFLNKYEEMFEKMGLNPKDYPLPPQFIYHAKFCKNRRLDCEEHNVLVKEVLEYGATEDIYGYCLKCGELCRVELNERGLNKLLIDGKNSKKLFKLYPFDYQAIAKKYIKKNCVAYIIPNEIYEKEFDLATKDFEEEFVLTKVN